MNEMTERRKRKDRRSYGRPDPAVSLHSRFPDRRLNNIASEWIPLAMVYSHSVTHRMFGIRGVQDAMWRGSPGGSRQS